MLSLLFTTTRWFAKIFTDMKWRVIFCRSDSTAGCLRATQNEIPAIEFHLSPHCSTFKVEFLSINTHLSAVVVVDGLAAEKEIYCILIWTELPPGGENALNPNGKICWFNLKWYSTIWKWVIKYRWWMSVQTTVQFELLKKYIVFLQKLWTFKTSSIINGWWSS